MKKLPANITHLNLTNEEYEQLSDADIKRICFELPKNDALCYSESNPKAEIPELPCVIDGIFIY